MFALALFVCLSVYLFVCQSVCLYATLPQGSGVVKAIRDWIFGSNSEHDSAFMQIAPSECLEYDNSGYFGGKGASPDGYVNE